MPMIRLQLSLPVEKDQQVKVMSQLSQAVAQSLGKPESYMMVVFEAATPILMGGLDDPAAFVEVRSVGTISGDQAQKLSQTISQVLTSAFKINANRIYTNFAGVQGAMWGYNGQTFG